MIETLEKSQLESKRITPVNSERTKPVLGYKHDFKALQSKVIELVKDVEQPNSKQ